MASRDYKARTPARGNGKGGRRSGSTMLVGIVIGVLVGLAAAIAIALYINKGPSPFTDRAPAGKSPDAKQEIAKPAPKPEPKKPAGDTKEPDRFDFYKILPGEKGTGNEAKPTAPATPKPTTTEETYLQVGAFQDAGQADNLKAKLALAGIEANIRTGSTADGKLWHRVRLGPFASVEDQGKALARLKENQFDAKVVKEAKSAGSP